MICLISITIISFVLISTNAIVSPITSLSLIALHHIYLQSKRTVNDLNIPRLLSSVIPIILIICTYLFLTSFSVVVLLRTILLIINCINFLSYARKNTKILSKIYIIDIIIQILLLLSLFPYFNLIKIIIHVVFMSDTLINTISLIILPTILVLYDKWQQSQINQSNHNEEHNTVYTSLDTLSRRSTVEAVNVLPSRVTIALSCNTFLNLY